MSADRELRLREARERALARGDQTAAWRLTAALTGAEIKTADQVLHEARLRAYRAGAADQFGMVSPMRALLWADLSPSRKGRARKDGKSHG